MNERRDDKKSDVGPWTVRRDENRQWRICSENFEHDVEMIVTGDFKDDAAFVEYAADIARRLSATPSATPLSAATIFLGGQHAVPSHEKVPEVGPHGFDPTNCPSYYDGCNCEPPSATQRSEELVILDAIGKLRNVRATAMELDDHSQGFKDGAQACLNELHAMLASTDGTTTP